MEWWLILQYINPGNLRGKHKDGTWPRATQEANFVNGREGPWPAWSARARRPTGKALQGRLFQSRRLLRPFHCGDLKSQTVTSMLHHGRPYFWSYTWHLKARESMHWMVVVALTGFERVALERNKFGDWPFAWLDERSNKFGHLWLAMSGSPKWIF